MFLQAHPDIADKVMNLTNADVLAMWRAYNIMLLAWFVAIVIYWLAMKPRPFWDYIKSRWLFCSCVVVMNLFFIVAAIVMR